VAPAAHRDIQVGRPMSFASFLFHSAPPAIPLRDLTRSELSDIGRLEQAVAIQRQTLRALQQVGFVDAPVAYDPADSAAQIAWEITQLEESICQIRRQPEIEAE
jgi:hypothetical protein